MGVLVQDESKVPCVLSVDDARSLMAEKNVLIADVRWYLDGRQGRAEFNSGHIPGAVFVDVDHDLANHHNTVLSNGRHPFPSPETFAHSLGRLGIGDNTHVIAYDDTGGMTAARLVVMLRMIGRSASLMNGGLRAWTASTNDPLETGERRAPQPLHFTPVPWPTHQLINVNDLLDIVNDDQTTAHTILLDARAANRFEGRAPEAVPTLDPQPGHIPGAVNSPWAAILDPETAHLRPPALVVEHFAGLGVTNSSDVVAYCGSGISACLNIVALEYAGLPPARLFVPSWSGWASDPDLPVEVGPATIPDQPSIGPTPTVGIAAVHALRTARQRHRLADFEWFEALYRVYLAAFIFGGSILFISGFVPDEPVSTPVAVDIIQYGPAWLGLVGVFALALGLRSGSRGGPLAIEEADVRHLLMAPVSRQRVLLRPALQRLRTVLFSATGVGAVAGQLAGRRLPGSTMSWAFAGAAWGATAGVLFVTAALVAHGLGFRHWMSSALGGSLLAWQLLSAVNGSAIAGPGDLYGGLALWGSRVRTWEILPSIVVITCAALSLLLLGRQSLEALSRRSALVAQLRFAVTLQDLRTVALLRRQLGHERSRSRPWIRLRRNAGPTAEWHRGWQGILRFPASRWARLVTLTVLAGFCLAVAYQGTTVAIVGAGLALFIVGLELLEPLAQEIDQGDRTDTYPKARGIIFLSLLTPSMAMAVPVAGIMVATMGIVEPEMWTTAFVISLPAVVAGIGGAAINIAAGSPDQLTTTVQQNMMPSEVAGTVSLVKAIWPLALSIAGSLPVVAAHLAVNGGNGPEAAALRVSIAVVLGIALIVSWIRFRDDIKQSIRQAAADGRQKSFPTGDRL